MVKRMKVKPDIEKSPGRTVAKPATVAGLDDLSGAMRGTVKIAPGIDLTEPTGEVWKALSDAPPE